MIELWFPTPIWYFKLNLNECDFSKAISYSIALSKNCNGIKVSNVGGWHSKLFSNQDLQKSPLKVFTENISTCVNICLTDLGASNDVKVYIHNAWININEPGHYNNKHDHGFTNLSGVFYLTDTNSNINFYKNKDFMDFTTNSVLSNNDTTCSFKKVTYQPKKGDLLIFPSWLEHDVEYNDFLDTRISVAFNLYSYVPN